MSRKLLPYQKVNEFYFSLLTQNLRCKLWHFPNEKQKNKERQREGKKSFQMIYKINKDKEKERSRSK